MLPIRKTQGVAPLPFSLAPEHLPPTPTPTRPRTIRVGVGVGVGGRGRVAQSSALTKWQWGVALGCRVAAFQARCSSHLDRDLELETDFE